MSKYSIHLSQEQRKSLEQIIHRGIAPVRKIMHAQVLLKTDQGQWGPRWPDRKIQETIGVGESTLKRIRQRFVSEGLQAALERKPHPERPEKRKLDGEQEALLVLLACSDAPHGHERWSINLLKERLIELQIVETVSSETVRMTLKKRVEAVAQAAVVYSVCGCQVCGGNGRRAGDLSTSLRCAASACMYG